MGCPWSRVAWVARGGGLSRHAHVHLPVLPHEEPCQRVQLWVCLVRVRVRVRVRDRVRVRVRVIVRVRVRVRVRLGLWLG